MRAVMGAARFVYEWLRGRMLPGVYLVRVREDDTQEKVE